MIRRFFKKLRPTRTRGIVMKKFFLIIFCVIISAFAVTSCRTSYLGHPVSYSNTFVSTSPNFKYLGTYCGTATEMKKRVSISDDKGLVYLAKQEMLDAIQKDSINLSDGNIELVNVAVEQTSNNKRIVVSVSADVIQIMK